MWELHQLENWVNLDRATHHRSWILSCPGLGVRTILAVENEEPIEPRGRGVHGSITGVRMTTFEGDAKGCCRGLAGVTVMKRACSLYLVQVLGEGFDHGIQLGRTRPWRLRLVDVLKKDVLRHVNLLIPSSASYPCDERESANSTGCRS